MKKMHSLFLLFVVFFLNSCPEPQNTYTYSPLYKYRTFDLIKYDLELFGLTNSNLDKYIMNHLIQLENYYCVGGGVISNNVRYFYSEPNVYRVSNEISNTHFTITPSVGAVFQAANEKYTVFSIGKELYILQINGSTNTNFTVWTNRLAISLAHGDSPLLAFAVLVETNMFLNQERPYNHHHMYLLNLENATHLQMIDANDIVGFSPNNHYLFFNNYTGVDYWLYSPNQGIVSIYDLEQTNYVSIGDLEFELKGSPLLRTRTSYWTDATIGITTDLKTMYICNDNDSIPLMNGTYPLFIDGREMIDIKGVWEVDITSLGLSE